MRPLAAAGLALVLLAGSLLVGPAGAQADGEELSFDSTCQQLRCFFEIENAEALEGNVSEVEWTFGPNETTETGNPVRYTFPEPGTYDVKVTVTSDLGDNATRQANATGEVRVTSGEVPWSAVIFGVVALVASVALARAT